MQEVNTNLWPDSLGESVAKVLIEIGIHETPLSSFDVHKTVGIGYSTVFTHCKKLEGYGFLSSYPDAHKSKPQKILYRLTFVGMCNAIFYLKYREIEGNIQYSIPKMLISLLNVNYRLDPIFEIYLNIIHQLDLFKSNMVTNWQLNQLWDALHHSCLSYTKREQDSRNDVERYRDFVEWAFYDIADKAFIFNAEQSEEENLLLRELYSILLKEYNKKTDLWKILEDYALFSLNEHSAHFKLIIDITGKEKVFEWLNSILEEK